MIRPSDTEGRARRRPEGAHLGVINSMRSLAFNWCQVFDYRH